MKIPRSLPDELRSLRRELGLGQKALEKVAGLKPGRMSVFERGLRTPREEEMRSLCRALGVPFAALTESTNWRAMSGGRRSMGDLSRLRELFGSSRPFRWPCEFPFEAHLAGVHREFRTTARALGQRIRGRRDRAAVERFLRELPCGARGEALLVLHLLADGWTPLHVAPLELGFADPRVRDFRDRPARPYVGHRRMPAFSTILEDLAAVVVPQLPLDGEVPCVLDFLAFIRTRGALLIADLEVDGPGHDASRDERRRQTIALDTLRLADTDLDDPEFQLAGRLKQFCLERGCPRRRLLNGEATYGRA